MAPVIDDIRDLPQRLPASCRPMPLPTRVLMCPPQYFDVIDVKNPHMAGHVGRVDRPAADRQWQGVRATFEHCAVGVELIEPLEGCEDMVFCANQTFVGLDPAGRPVCVLSNMKHASRQREVPAFKRWFRSAGYRIERLTEDVRFEGGGDAIWHPGHGLIWGGYGRRSEPAAYERLSEIFDAPVIRLRLLSERFYHLDTCFCPLDERTVLVNPRSLEPRGLELIRAVFERVIESPPEEADCGLACNATAIGGRRVLIQSGNPRTLARLRACGYEVHEVDTSEFLKSGGSVYCMKLALF